MSKDAAPRSLVVVVGDWVVDEYWRLVSHRSRISSHIGYAHYRLDTDDQQEVLDLCGAGHVARILTELASNTQEPGRYQVWGVGSWHSSDHRLFQHLLHSRANPECRANKPGFRIMSEFCDCLPETAIVTLSPKGPTTRVVRQYHGQQDGGLEQLNRIDWEAKDKQPPDLGLLSALPAADSFDNILLCIVDLQKGVVSPDFVAALAGKYPEATWFIRSKIEKPQWLTKLESIEILVAGPEVVEHRSPWASWVTHQTISHEAMLVLDSLSGENKILISEHRDLICQTRPDTDGMDLLVTSYLKASSTGAASLGFATAILALLVDRFARGQHSIDDLDRMLNRAEAFARIRLFNAASPATARATTSKKKWEQESEDWKFARSEMGLIERNGRKKLDIWRGSSALDGYVTCIERKEEIINELGRAVRGFTAGGPRHTPLSILINADPGSGKTHLAKCLASAFGLALMRFDITQMVHKDDLFALFDSVATHQANSSADLLVFVDEINASLDGNQVYGSFLAPLEDGYYVRRGSSFSLRPCIWLFAGTENESKQDRGSDRKEKLSDFESRMSQVKRIDYESLKTESAGKKQFEATAKLEQVYLGAIMIRRYFPDVTRVSEAVLRHFYGMNPAEVPARHIRRLCTTLQNVQYGEVSRRNCEEWGAKNWPKGDKSFVELNF
ncbi:MAG: AAA family ATPase [Burkholderiaceae bacterium]